MDAMAHALKKKIGGVHITVEPINDELPEDAGHLVQESKLDIETWIRKT
jgi:hypothetical protein